MISFLRLEFSHNELALRGETLSLLLQPPPPSFPLLLLHSVPFSLFPSLPFSSTGFVRSPSSSIATVPASLASSQTHSRRCWRRLADRELASVFVSLSPWLEPPPPQNQATAPTTAITSTVREA
ncbi:hypothetical protein RIF29_03740 [Crotalaria pallida]|uniref:Uncharacterized protein n=1 Tax=Crotalaria pallida TaxID=3830 RepID=A0AAN9J197_CROPI